MQAYRIVNWKKMYELTAKGKPANENTPIEDIRKSPFPYIRMEGEGHMLGPAKRRMFKKAWPYGDNMDMKCWGLYISLLDLARDQVNEYRGWILDDLQRPINPVQIAEVLGIQESKINEMFEVLTCKEVRWVELVDFPEFLQNNMAEIQDVNLEKQTSSPQNSPGQGENGGEVGKPFLNQIESESEEEHEQESKPKGNWGEKGSKGESQGVEDVAQPQARPQPPVSVSDSASVTDSVSEKLSDSASASDSDPDSVAGAGAGPGAASTEPGADVRPGPIKSNTGHPEGRGFEAVSSHGRERFEITRECQKATLELTQIIHPRNNSDVTTINDIFSQLKQRLISGSPYPLFELSLNTARQCWRGNKPIAMFVAAMKKPPFYYVPKKLNVIPGKFSRVKDKK